MSDLVKWNSLGKSGLKISNVILGCMSFGSTEWANFVVEDEDKVFEILKKAYDMGIRTYDTADVYSNGLSEVLLGKFLKKFNIPREKVVIMTKVFFQVDESLGHRMLFTPGALTAEQELGLINGKGLSRKHIFEAVEGSLRRLDTPYIDLYQIHRYDHSTPPEETMKALNDLIEMGKVHYIGASAMKVVDLLHLQHVADKNNWQQFISVQSQYNLLTRVDEEELNYYASKFGVGLTPYSPLASGFLARELAKDLNSLPTPRANITAAYSTVYTEDTSRESDKEIINRVGELAEKYNTSRTAISLAWLIAKNANPIVGIGKVERLDDLLIASNLKLDESDIKYLEEPYEPKLRSFLQ